MPLHALSVDLAERSYPVLVGPGARHEVARFLPPTAKSAVIVTQEAIKDAGWVDGLDPGLPAELLPPGWTGARAAEIFFTLQSRLAAAAGEHAARAGRAQEV